MLTLQQQEEESFRRLKMCTKGKTSQALCVCMCARKLWCMKRGGVISSLSLCWFYHHHHHHSLYNESPAAVDLWFNEKFIHSARRIHRQPNMQTLHLLLCEVCASWMRAHHSKEIRLNDLNLAIEHTRQSNAACYFGCNSSYLFF